MLALFSVHAEAVAQVAPPGPLPLVNAGVEPPPVGKSLEALDELLIGYLQSMPPDRDHPHRPSAARAQRAVSSLRALSVKWPAQSPLDYRRNLNREVGHLQTVLERSSQWNTAETIAALAEDLEIKLEHCVKSGGRLGGSVSVRVRTIQGGQEVRHWQVFYLPRALEALGNATADRFPQLSSPTTELLVPGRYMMWSSDPVTGRLGSKTVIKVGEGRKDLAIDLTVPGR
jgi:hypothetical protein